MNFEGSKIADVCSSPIPPERLAAVSGWGLRVYFEWSGLHRMWLHSGLLIGREAAECNVESGGSVPGEAIGLD